MRFAVLILLAQLFTSAAFSWTIQRSQGTVMLKAKGQKRAAAAGAVLKEGDTLETGADGKAQLQDGESELWLASSTTFTVHKLTNEDFSKKGRLDLITGKLRAKFKRPSGPQDYPYDVKTKSVVAGVRGTEFFVAAEGGEEKVCTLEGLVRVSSAKSAAEYWDVAAGRGLFIKPNEMPKVRETSSDQAKKWVEATSF